MNVDYFIIFLLSAFGSFLNVPVFGSGYVEVKRKRFLGLFKERLWAKRGVLINIGGGLIPVTIAGFYFLQNYSKEILVIVFFIILFSFIGAKYEKKRGILASVFLTAFFSSLLSILLIPESALSAAYTTSVLGIFVGADILHLPALIRREEGSFILGGAGIFDAIFLVGILSLVMTSFYNQLFLQ